MKFGEAFVYFALVSSSARGLKYNADKFGLKTMRHVTVDSVRPTTFLDFLFYVGAVHSIAVMFRICPKGKKSTYSQEKEKPLKKAQQMEHRERQCMEARQLGR